MGPQGCGPADPLSGSAAPAGMMTRGRPCGHEPNQAADWASELAGRTTTMNGMGRSSSRQRSNSSSSATASTGWPQSQSHRVNAVTNVAESRNEIWR